jgi:hypothetical protein
MFFFDTGIPAAKKQRKTFQTILPLLPLVNSPSTIESVLNIPETVG